MFGQPSNSTRGVRGTPNALLALWIRSDCWAAPRLHLKGHALVVTTVQQRCWTDRAFFGADRSRKSLILNDLRSRQLSTGLAAVQQRGNGTLAKSTLQVLSWQLLVSLQPESNPAGALSNKRTRNGLSLRHVTSIAASTCAASRPASNGFFVYSLKGYSLCPLLVRTFSLAAGHCWLACGCFCLGGSFAAPATPRMIRSNLPPVRYAEGGFSIVKDQRSQSFLCGGNIRHDAHRCVLDGQHLLPCALLLPM